MFSNADGLAQALITQWLETDPLPHLVIDRSLRLHWKNKASAEHVLHCAFLEIHDEHLRARVPEHRARLEAFAATLGPNPSTLSLNSDKEGDRLFLRGRAISLNDADHRLGLRICREGHGDLIRLSEELPELYGLTRAECVVLEALMKGNTAEQSALRIGVSIETVRTHIRRIYKKLNVGSREELYAKLQAHLLMA